MAGIALSRREWLAGSATAAWCFPARATAGTAPSTHSPDPDAPVHALLVGCAHYPQLSPWRQLPGASADVALMRRTLQAYYGSSLQCQTWDSADASAAPTHRALMRALDTWATSVPPGGIAWLYLAGHGTQRPQLSAARGAGTAGLAPRYPEPDGLDELFLPVDCGRWQASAATVARSITDDDIGERLALLQERGVAVVAMFDTCHAAGMDRSASAPGAAASSATRERAVALPELGGPKPLVRPAKVTGTHSPVGEHRQATLLYACRPHEVTHESWMTGTQRAPARHGVFTWHFVQAWQALVQASRPWRLRDLEVTLHQRYAADQRVHVHPQLLGVANHMGGWG